MNGWKRILIVLLSVLLVLGTTASLGCASNKGERFFSGEALAYYNSLLSMGFPEDYAEELTELHLVHPTWEFTPLMITQIDSAYTWDFVMENETNDPSLNLIAPTASYEAYRQSNNSKTYDSGYYQASADAVAYFMDPRNFINETDIFQFLDLSASSSASLAAIEAVLLGSFMENTVMENGKTYAQNFAEIGSSVGVHPVYLAVKVYQEQGKAGNSPLVSGDCGDVLWNFYDSGIKKTSSGAEILAPSRASYSELMSLNGYYNLMNVGASGKGVFTIYQNAALRAQEGSEEMREAWGGDPSWNTAWKSLWGGAILLKESYIDRYQSTVYLQKFNVDSRSGRTFWGQYMQNIAGALIEGRSLYQSFAEIGALDSACSFLIPIYEDMPSHASADPANGSCSYLRSTDQKYHFSTSMRYPFSLRLDSAPIYRSVSVTAGEKLHVNGLLSHDYGIRRVEYSLDGGEWLCMYTDGRFDFVLSPASLSSGTHILVIRGIADYDGKNAEKKSNSHFLGAVLYLTVESAD